MREWAQTLICEYNNSQYFYAKRKKKNEGKESEDRGSSLPMTHPKKDIKCFIKKKESRADLTQLVDLNRF